MRIGYVGDGLFATAAIQRLLATHQVTTFTPESDEAVNHGGAAAASTLAQLARDADVIVVSLP
ncbi:MAG TPA: hypothetical protein VFB54_00340, partial [Burkholderiales bacterium]|nr:hypothetical protein [Burkholderiales bacterium]